jgi:hypothetical protein
MLAVTSELANAVSEYGFPIIAAMGMGYFIFFVWKWVTTEVKPVLNDANTTLIKLVDRIRMLDNDMIRLNTKLSMVLEYRNRIEQAQGESIDEELEEIINRNKSVSETFNSTGEKDNGS